MRNSDGATAGNQDGSPSRAPQPQSPSRSSWSTDDLRHGPGPVGVLRPGDDQAWASAGIGELHATPVATRPSAHTVPLRSMAAPARRDIHHHDGLPPRSPAAGRARRRLRGSVSINATGDTVDLGPGTGNVAVGGNPLDPLTESRRQATPGPSCFGEWHNTDSVTLNGNAANVLRSSASPRRSRPTRTRR